MAINNTECIRILRPAAIGFVFAVALSGGAGVAWSLAQDTDSTSGPQATDTTQVSAAPEGVPDHQMAYRDFPTNSRGLTYGSDARAASLRDAPDLVAVVGDHGSLGFVYAKDLYAVDAMVRTPEDAIAYERRLKEVGPPTFDVYDVEGVKVVDTFTVDLGTVSYH